MPFISYAQNHEDVMLWRALKHIDKGFYIDIGACFPSDGSVTKLFYDLGWHGINIEPHPEAFQQLINERKHDINLELAISDVEGEIELFEGNSIGETSAIKQNNSGKSFFAKSMSLRKVCEKYITGDISFLKIDVEGLEFNVIKSGDWHQFRPKIVVCETTKRWSNEKRSDVNEINNFFKENKYQHVYFDGLNSYYVANEEREIISKLSFQPNVIDGYVSINEYSLEIQKSDLQVKLNLADDKLKKKDFDFDELRSDNDQLRLDNQQIRLDRTSFLEQLSTINVEKVLALQENNALLDENESIKTKLQFLQSEHNSLLTKLDNLWQEKENTRKQLNEVWQHRDAVIMELNNVYHSHSFRLMTPFRFVMGKFRTFRGKLANLISIIRRNIIVTPIKSIIQFSMKIFRKMFPKLFYKLSHNMKLRRQYLKITLPAKNVIDSNVVNSISIGQKASSMDINSCPIKINESISQLSGNELREKMKEEIQHWQLGERNYE